MTVRPRRSMTGPAGMAFRVPLVRIASVRQAIVDLKKRGFKVYALAGEGSMPIGKAAFDHPAVFILGNEGSGIEPEVRKLCDDAYSRAKELITKHRDKLEIIAKALLEFETLDGVQIRDIIEHGEMRNPPAPPPKQNRSEPPPLLPQEDRSRGSMDFPPGLSEQPA